MLEKFRNVRTGVVGVGSMGKHHARIYSEISNLIAVSDSDSNQGKKIANHFGIKYYKDYRLMLDEVDAISIAVPTILHLEVAKAALEAGVNVLVEKPIASSIEESIEIIKIARRSKKVLAVGHIERHNPVVEYLKDSLDKDKYGKPITLSTCRVSSLPTRIRDVGVVYDMAIHDIDILRYLSGSEVLTVYAVGGKANGMEYEDHCLILIEYSNGITSFSEVNWLTPIKVRQLTITTRDYFIKSDYSEQSVEILSSEYLDLDNSNLSSTNLDVKKEIIPIKKEEPLKKEILDFLSSIINNHAPKITGEDGLRAMIIANAVLKSIETGSKINLDPEFQAL